MSGRCRLADGSSGWCSLSPTAEIVEGTNEQGSVNDRNCGILRYEEVRLSSSELSIFMADNHSFFSMTLETICMPPKNYTIQTWKIPQTEVWAFVHTYLCLYMDLRPSGGFCLTVCHSPLVHKGTEYEEEIHNFLALHGMRDDWNYY